MRPNQACFYCSLTGISVALLDRSKHTLTYFWYFSLLMLNNEAGASRAWYQHLKIAINGHFRLEVANQEQPRFKTSTQKGPYMTILISCSRGTYLIDSGWKKYNHEHTLWMNQMIENVAMKLTHIHVAIHLSSFAISHQCLLSAPFACLSTISPWGRPNSATSSTIHIDARTSWMGLIATFFQPQLRLAP